MNIKYCAIVFLASIVYHKSVYFYFQIFIHSHQPKYKYDGALLTKLLCVCVGCLALLPVEEVVTSLQTFLQQWDNGCKPTCNTDVLFLLCLTSSNLDVFNFVCRLGNEYKIYKTLFISIKEGCSKWTSDESNLSSPHVLYTIMLCGKFEVLTFQWVTVANCGNKSA